MARSLKPISLLDGEIPSDQHHGAKVGNSEASAVKEPSTQEPAQKVLKGRAKSAAGSQGSARRRANGSRPTREAERASAPAPRKSSDPAAAAGHPEHVALMLPPTLWGSYDELAFDLSEAGGERVSTSALIKAVLLHRLPEEPDAAYRLAVDWLEARLGEDDPYGHEAPVQRNLLLYASQRGALDRLARHLKRQRLPGARSKLICAVLHFRRPSDVSEARGLVRKTRLAPHQPS